MRDVVHDVATSVTGDDSHRLQLEDHRDWTTRYLTDRSMTIAGGTTEIQRNIVAERILGLPRS